MTKVYYCEFRVCGNFAFRYVIARNKINAVELITLHFNTLSPLLKVTDITVRDLEFISSQSISNLISIKDGNSKKTY